LIVLTISLLLPCWSGIHAYKNNWDLHTLKTIDMNTNTSVPTEAGPLETEAGVLVSEVSAFASEASVLVIETGGLTADASLVATEASVLATETGGLAAEASLFAAEAMIFAAEARIFAAEASAFAFATSASAPEAETFVSPTLQAVTSIITVYEFLDVSAPATQASTSKTVTITGASTSIFVSRGHTTTSVTPVLSTDVTVVPVPSSSPIGAPSTVSKINIGDIIGGAIAAVVVLAVVSLIFCRLRRRKRAASVEQRISEFGINYQPTLEPLLVGTPPHRPPSSLVARHSRVFSITLSVDPSPNSPALGFAASVAFATDGESVRSSYFDEKTAPRECEQRTNSRSTPGMPRSPSVHSSLYSPSTPRTSDLPPSYQTTECCYDLRTECMSGL